ncbi:hypothetical protein [Desulfovibrio gilichinskyi]|uniref:Tetratricopeptide repeat-containing protein n=1 Tax=Desulfovibrio gilichinskyi TaxID=1519643 RepID=A0A1X7EAZ1_9BACT|nr:hypothetical protein [Desulfovibrio gilichinskyi]SMF30651.1 hypothetical protein SAMN06295933_2840 [Desulfovibrio gilichinskyi]
MKIKNFNFEYMADNRLPDQYLEEIVEYLSDIQKERFKIGIYGMGEAGVKIFTRLKCFNSVLEILCFDAGSVFATKDIKIFKPDQISDFIELGIIINTVPPQFTFDVLKVIYLQNPELNVLNLYDVLLYVKDDRNWDFSYKMLAKSVGFKGEVALYYTKVANVINRRVKESLKRLESARKFSNVEVINLLMGQEKCLGEYLEAELVKAIDATNGKVEKLIELAERFPFFTIARDIAACLLIHENLFKDAVNVFKPALLLYPCCHQSLAKYAELQAISGDYEGAQESVSRACYFSPESKSLLASAKEIEGKNRTLLINKWKRRKVRPDLKKRKVSLKCSTPVWGEIYIKNFMEVGLRSLFASGNIPYAANEHQVSFTIYTREQDFECVKSYKEWDILSSLVSAELVSIESVIKKRECTNKSFCKYSMLSICQNDALEEAYLSGSVAFIPLADFIFSADYIKSALHKLDLGYDVIFGTGFKVSQESFVEKIVHEFSDGRVIEAPSIDLFAVGIKYIHPFSVHSMDANYTPLWPNYYTYKNNDEQYIHNMFGSNPLFIYQNEKLEIDSTLDADLPYKAVDGGLRRYLFADEIDGMMLFEIVSENSELGNYCKKKRSSECSSYWIQGTIDPVSRFMGTRLIVFKSSNADVERGEKYFKAVEETIDLVL